MIKELKLITQIIFIFVLREIMAFWPKPMVIEFYEAETMNLFEEDPLNITDY